MNLKSNMEHAMDAEFIRWSVGTVECREAQIIGSVIVKGTLYYSCTRSLGP